MSAQPTLVITVPLKTGRGQNNREHWAETHRRISKEKEAVGWYLRTVARKPPKPPLNVLMTRTAPSTGLDDDNLTGALKGVRDAIALWLGIDDGNRDAVRYHCEQETSVQWGVRIAFYKVDVK